TAKLCERLKRDGTEPMVSRKTGLLLDPYFSATKIAWLLDNVQGARGRAERGELLAGTLDTYTLWRLSGGRIFATDPSTACRTLLATLDAGRFDPELARVFDVPFAMLAEVVASDAP